MDRRRNTPFLYRTLSTRPDEQHMQDIFSQHVTAVRDHFGRHINCNEITMAFSRHIQAFRDDNVALILRKIYAELEQQDIIVTPEMTHQLSEFVSNALQELNSQSLDSQWPAR